MRTISSKLLSEQKILSLIIFHHLPTYTCSQLFLLALLILSSHLSYVSSRQCCHDDHCGHERSARSIYVRACAHIVISSDAIVHFTCWAGVLRLIEPVYALLKETHQLRLQLLRDRRLICTQKICPALDLIFFFYAKFLDINVQWK